LEIFKEEGVKYELTSIGTILEGDLKDVFEVAKKTHESVFDEEVSRVVTSIRIDDRKDKDLKIKGKKRFVEKKLGE